MTCLVQYEHGEVCDLIQKLNASFDSQIDIDTFYNEIYNLKTAGSFGLDVWGRFLNVSRIVKGDFYSTNFGFEGSGLLPFNQGVFFNAKYSSANNVFILDDQLYRGVLLMKFYSLFSNGSIGFINIILKSFFGERGLIYVVNDGTMKYKIISSFNLENWEKTLFISLQSLPVPAGVSYEIEEI